jgi:hypothetical protein
MLRRRIIPLGARNSALHYLANNDKLSDERRRQLSEVVYGHIGSCDEDAARKGMEWMREQYRARGKTPTF